MSTERRAGRSDGRANRERILQVAEEVFGRGGDSASTEEVAKLAGVGIATVFRHFPTKVALLEAVLTGRLHRLRDEAAALVGSDDPGAAFYGFFTHMVDDSATKIAIGEALVAAGAVLGDDNAAPVVAAREVQRAVGVLLERAQEAGAVRDDVELPEMYALLVGAARAASVMKLDPEVRARTLAIIFDGLAPR